MYEMVQRLDDIGKPAWIALMVLGFVLFWPIGLAILAYLIWSGRMGCGRHGEMSEWQRRMADRWERKRQRWGHRGPGWGRGPGGYASSGNRAFDEYREATLQRLEEEVREFREFLDRLKMARDKSEFDQFMAERRNRDAAGSAGEQPPTT